MRLETGEIELTLGTEKFKRTYEKKVYESIEDILKEVAEDEKKNTMTVLRNINMGEDWERRTAARKEFLNEDGDAAKAASIEAQVKAFVKAREKAGKPISNADARKKVLAMMED